MSWQTKSVSILRYMVNDDSGVSYTDDELERSILISSLLIQQDADFDYDYTVDIDASSISPDPVNDNDFITLACMRSRAAIFGNLELINRESVTSFKDGPSSITMKDNTKNIAQKAQDAYEQAIKQYQLGNSIGANAVIGPIVVDGLEPNWGNIN